MKRLVAFSLALIVLLSVFSSTVFACNENQTNTYVAQILFGDSAGTRSSDEHALMLFNALYLCCEQTGGQGQDKIDYLKAHRVSGIPALNSLTIKADYLLACSHNTWEHEFPAAEKNQANRRKVLRNTVNKVFDFGTFNNWFNSSGGKCDSFAALLYYSHILSDYLADDPAETEVSVGGKFVSAYSGQPYVSINGNTPTFTPSQKKITTSFKQFSPLDALGRAGVAFANVGPDTLSSIGPRLNMAKIQTSGWNYNKYEGMVNSQPAYVYNKCHLLAHSLGGVEEEPNLVTGTRYMNETGMKPFEDMVANYIRRTINHVLYRVTPVFKRDNKLVSGVQIEAFSVEDAGEGISFNVYCYNVQPGVELNYANGENAVSDITFGANDIIPFAVTNPSDSNPDLIYEINKHLAILFDAQKNSSTYTSMINSITTIANEARAVGNHGENSAKCYILLKEYQYKYFDVLKSYVPLLLNKEEFFNSVFK